MLSTDSYSNILYLNPKQDTAKGFLFGLQILFLPDFLLDHTLLGKEPPERIQEYCPLDTICLWVVAQQW
ncbi:MAG: hypothetical protein ACKO90_01410 [Microcystis panniformis]